MGNNLCILQPSDTMQSRICDTWKKVEMQLKKKRLKCNLKGKYAFSPHLLLLSPILDDKGKGMPHAREHFAISSCNLEDQPVNFHH